MGKGKVHYIEVHSDSDEEEEVAPKQGNEQGALLGRSLRRRRRRWLSPLYQAHLDSISS
jgi:hypothetical protein